MVQREWDMNQLLQLVLQEVMEQDKSLRKKIETKNVEQWM